MFSHPLVMDHTPVLSVSKEITKDSAKLQSEIQPRWLRVRDNTDLISHYLRKLQRNQTPTRPDSIKCYIAVMELGSALQQALHPHRAALLKEEDPRFDSCPALLSPAPIPESSPSRQESSPSRQENSPSRQPQRPSTDSAELSASDSETETDSSEFMRLPSISSFDSALPMASRAQYPWVQHTDPHSLHTQYAHHQHAYNHQIQNHQIQNHQIQNHQIQNHQIQNHQIQNHQMLPFHQMQQPSLASSYPLDKRQNSPKQELVKQELVKQELVKQELAKQDSDPATRFQQHSFIYHHQLDSKANKAPRKTPSPIKAPPQVPFLSPKPAGTSLPSSTPIHASRAPLSQEMPTKKRRRVRNTSGLGLVCEECSATETPEWRRGPNGSKTLCNACGLQYAKKIKREQKEREIRDQLERSSISFSAPVRINTDVTLTAPNVVGRFDSLPMAQRHDLSSPSLSRHLNFASPSVAPQTSAKDFKASPSYTFHSHSCA